MATVREVITFDAREMPRATSEYVAAIDDRIDGDDTGLSAASLWRLSSDMLSEQRARITIVGPRYALAAGCHVTQYAPLAFEIKGLFKAGWWVSPSVPRVVVAQAILDTAARHGEQATFGASIRVFPSGWLDGRGRSHGENLASRALMQEFAFIVDGAPQSCAWLGTHSDRHLKPSLEPDRTTYRNQHLRSTDRTVERARQFLATVAAPA